MRILIFLADIFYEIKAAIQARISLKSRANRDKIFLDSCHFNAPKFPFLAHLDSSDFKNRALIIEANAFHFETLEAVVWYFKKLHFSLDLLVRNEFSEDFSDSSAFSGVEIFRHNLREILFILRDSRLSRYKIIFFNTTRLQLESFYSLPQILAQNRALRGVKISGICHTISDIARFGDFGNRYFALRDLSQKNISLRGLNLAPVRASNAPTQNSEINFISIGFYIYHAQFRRILREILDTNKSARFFIVGRMPFKFSHENIVFTQSPNLRELEAILARSHYIFAHYASFAHRHYLKTTTSGAFCLSLGYNIPLIINEPFLSAFGLKNAIGGGQIDKQNALIYHAPRDIKCAIELAKSAEYAKLRANLAHFSSQMRQKSLEILRDFMREV